MAASSITYDIDAATLILDLGGGVTVDLSSHVIFPPILRYTSATAETVCRVSIVTAKLIVKPTGTGADYEFRPDAIDMMGRLAWPVPKV